MTNKHQGATTSNKFYRTIEVRCIYSGNLRRYTITTKPTEKILEAYQDKFMNEECQCESCTEKRKSREKLKRALRESRATRELYAIGER